MPRIGTISRQLRTASNSQSVISTTLPMSPATAPCATVANCASASATGPVIAHMGLAVADEFQALPPPRVLPASPRRRARSELKSSLGCARTKSVLAAEITHLAAQQALPGQSAADGPDRGRHGRVEGAQLTRDTA